MTAIDNDRDAKKRLQYDGHNRKPTKDRSMAWRRWRRAARLWWRQWRATG